MNSDATSLRAAPHNRRHAANACRREGSRPIAAWNVLLLLFCILLPSHLPAAVLPDGAYLIQMADSDMAVVSSGLTMRERVTIRMDNTKGTWHFEHLGNDYYRVNAKAMIMVLDSQESKKYNGVPVISFPWHGAKNQRWKVLRKGPYYSLINQETGLALDLKGNSYKAGNVFQGYTHNDSRGQLFRLTPIDQIHKRNEQQSKEERKAREEDQMKEYSNSPHPDPF